ncbi:MAG: hypothetical protein ABMB14_26740 [Myxococcota bacterium]
MAIGVHWGEVPLLTDQGQTRDLEVVLPSDVGPAVYDLVGLPRHYSEGRWSTDRVDGEVRVVDLEVDRATIEVDAVADPDGLDRPINGQIVVRRGRRPHCDR